MTWIARLRFRSLVPDDPIKQVEPLRHHLINGYLLSGRRLLDAIRVNHGSDEGVASFGRSAPCAVCSSPTALFCV